MSFTAWMAAGGALLLTMALSSALIKRLPVSTAAIYLGVGCAIGPWGFELLRIDLNDSAPWVERLTEIAVILSLFIGFLADIVIRGFYDTQRKPTYYIRETVGVYRPD